jgi:L-asparaginase / beta-aspartyl-peptidase
MGKYGIAIHGGAGTILRSAMTAEREKGYHGALRDCILIGEEILKHGGSALDAVEAAVIAMEDVPLFNAARGAVFTYKGKNEMDASIMEGQYLKAGSIAGVKNVRNPIKLARAVMDKSEHVFLSGDEALEFGQQFNIETAPDEYFFIETRYEQWRLAKMQDTIILDHTEISETKEVTGDQLQLKKSEQKKNELLPPPDENKFGTVGAVACDRFGNIAAATSTGGMTNKKYGRIGDSPIIGAGTYANNTTCAVSCTGHGEFFIRAVVAYDVSCLMEYKGLTLKQACDYVVKEKLLNFGGAGGLIAIDANTNIELNFNTEGMYRAMKREGEEIYSGIYGE